MDLKKKKKKTHTSSVSMICSVNVIYTLCTESFNMRQYTIVNKIYICVARTRKSIRRIHAECWLRYQHAYEKIIRSLASKEKSRIGLLIPSAFRANALHASYNTQLQYTHNQASRKPRRLHQMATHDRKTNHTRQENRSQLGLQPVPYLAFSSCN